MIGDELRPHQLYRLYDAAGRLLYVGMTCNLCRRLRQHSRTSAWWPAVASGTAEQFPDRFTARQAERATIAEERPEHNQDRSLHPSDRSLTAARRVTDSDRSVTVLKCRRSLPQTAVDLRGYLSVTDSDRNSVRLIDQRRARAQGRNFPNTVTIGHCGHCDHCTRRPT